MEPTLSELLESNREWIFVGGKGGVGKTTTSCSLATMFANKPILDATTGATRPRRVLLISTDPAHNLSDAFNQKIGKTPTVIKSTETPETLFAMEIDPKQVIDNYGSLSAMLAGSEGAEKASAENAAAAASPFAAIGGILKNAASTLPGIDELSVFAEILTNVKRLHFDLVIFDTAPTGHTLRMLALPQTLNTTIDKLLQLEGLAPLLEAAGSMWSSATASGSTDDGTSGAAASSTQGPLTTEGVKSTVNKWREMLQSVQDQFNDAEKTCFLCVCIPEFLSVHETENLVQQLMRYNIACDSIVVNQLVMKPSSEPPCRMCQARMKIQGKYLEQIDDLYEDFHVVKMPLMSNEVRGVAALGQFGKFLLTPYDADKDGYLEVGTC